MIELTTDGGAAALHGPHKVYFSPNLNTSGAISLTTASNRVFRTHLLGLYYFHAASGQSVLLAPIQDFIGELVPPNQIVYHDAFKGVKADVRMTYTKAGFETDVILKEQPQPPEAYGLSSKTARLEIWHKFLDPPAPQKTSRVLKPQTDATLRQRMAEPDLVDETLNFGDLWFPLGRAFFWEAAANSTVAPAQIRLSHPATETNQVLVAKQWLQVQQRNLLIESVEWPDIAPKLESLPQAGKVASTSDLKDRVTKGRQFPATKVAAKKSSKAMRVAAAPYRCRGYVLDYVTVPSSGIDYSFDSGTYYINGNTYFSGTLTFGYGSVIKLSNGSYLLTYGSVAGGDGYVYALNSNGALRWRYYTASAIYSSPTIGPDGLVYVGTYNGKLFALQGSGTLAATPWPMYKHDLRHAGRLP